MGIGAGLCMYDVVVKKFTFAISSPDEFLVLKWPTYRPRNCKNRPSPFLISDIAVFVLKRDFKLQPTNQPTSPFLGQTLYDATKPGF